MYVEGGDGGHLGCGGFREGETLELEVRSECEGFEKRRSARDSGEGGSHVFCRCGRGKQREARGFIASEVKDGGSGSLGCLGRKGVLLAVIGYRAHCLLAWEYLNSFHVGVALSSIRFLMSVYIPGHLNQYVGVEDTAIATSHSLRGFT